MAVNEDPPELVRRSVGMVLAQARQGGATAMLLGGLFGFVYVPAAGWLLYLAWYVPFAAAIGARQLYFSRVLARGDTRPQVLRRIVLMVAFTGWLAPASVPLFAHYLSIADLGVLTVITVGWASVAVAVLAVQPRVYALYLAACFATVYLAWTRHAGGAELLMIGASMVLGGRMLVNLARVVWAQLRDTVDAAEQNASLVLQLRLVLERQQETQRSRSRFLGAASHDLRQPVQALLFLSDIFRKSTDPARRDAMAQQIVRTGESIDGMFRHLVDFAQIDAGTMKAVLQPVRLEPLVAAVASGFAEKCAARGLAFRIDMPQPCTAAADPVLLERMLRNFLDNAFKYSLRGEIVLAVGVVGGQAELSVTDQGVGMDDEDVAQACKAFVRGRSAALAEAEGIGLGLAISRHMADLMQFDLQLESTAGVGTRVSFRVDLVVDETFEADTQSPHVPDVPLAGWLVAVVEDDRLAREALTAWLLQAGARVAAGGSLQELQRVLHDASDAPDLVVADFRLGHGTGVEAIETLRSQFGEDLPALLLSGEADMAARGLPYPVLQKPVTPDRLLEALCATAPQWTGGGEEARSRRLTPARAKA